MCPRHEQAPRDTPKTIERPVAVSVRVGAFVVWRAPKTAKSSCGYPSALSNEHIKNAVQHTEYCAKSAYQALWTKRVAISDNTRTEA
jgi:hypothetical protein